MRVRTVESCRMRIDEAPRPLALGAGAALGVSFGLAGSQAVLGAALTGLGLDAPTAATAAAWAAGAAVGAAAFALPWFTNGQPSLRRKPREPQRFAVSGASHFQVSGRAVATVSRRVRLETRTGAIEAVKFIVLDEGTFRMGGDRHTDEQPIHEVSLPRFAMQETPVTRALYAAVMGEAPDNHQDADPQSPVVDVSWFDAVRFCNRASEAAGLQPAYTLEAHDLVRWDPHSEGLRLPMEAEWEYAVRAGTDGDYFFGDEARAEEFAWFDGAVDRPQPVGGKAPNPWGLHDMVGNVLEWCWDAWADDYQSHVKEMTTPDFNVREGPDVGRVRRGGSFLNSADWLRSADRVGNGPADRYGLLGFRCVLGSRPQPWSFEP